jgi:NAD-dependent deacetylase
MRLMSCGSASRYGAAWKAAVAAVKECDVLISIGTSGVVMPAASIPQLALKRGGVVIHVNVADVLIGDTNELMLTGSAADVLPKLVRSVQVGTNAPS